MPNWKTHLEVGIRLNEYLKYDKEELNLFFIGSIVPDINNGWLISDVTEKIEHDITHMGNFRNASYINFYNKYKAEIDNKNPLFVGYMAHLYTDYLWNKDFYTSIEKLNIQKENRSSLRIMKQNDFKIYNNKFIKNTIEIGDLQQALREMKKISIISITKEELLRAIQFINTQKVYESELEFYSITELDRLMNDTITGYIDVLKSYNIIN